MARGVIHVKDIYPVMGMFGEILVGRKGTFTMGWELTWPVSYSCSEKDYDEMVSRLSDAIAVLPPWTVVHRQEAFLEEEWHADPLVQSFLGESYQRHFDGRRYLSHKSYIFITLASRLLVQKGDRSSGFLGIRGMASEPSAADLASFRIKCTEFQSVLSAGGLVGMRVLESRDWLGQGQDVGLIQRYMMLGDGSPMMSDLGYGRDYVSAYGRTAMVFNVGESDQLPGVVQTSMKVRGLSSPVNDVLLSFAAAVGTNLDCEHILNQIIIVPPQDQVIHEEESEMKKMVAGYSSTDNRVNSEDLSEFLDDNMRNSFFMVRAHVNLITWGRTDEQRLNLIGKVRAAFKQMGVTSAYNNRNAPFVYYASIPSCAFEIGEDNVMTMEVHSAVCLFPFETFDSGFGKGSLLITDRQRGVPIFVDTQKIAQGRNLIGGFNGFILGPTGSGKSFFTNLLVRNLYDRGQAVFIIDIGDSYQGQCAIVSEESGGRDGQYLKWDVEHPFSFNPFVGWTGWFDSRKRLRQDEPGVNFLISFLQTVWTPKGGWTSERTPVLIEMLTRFLLECNPDGDLPILDDFFRYVRDVIKPKILYRLPREGKAAAGGRRRKTAGKSAGEASAEPSVAASLSEEEKAALLEENALIISDVQITPDIFDIELFVLALGPYTEDGVFSFLLNDRHPKDLFSSRFVVFEVKALSDVKDENFYSVCILCMMNAFERKMTSGGSVFKNLVVEEAWKALANRTMAPYLDSLWRTARKSSAACYVVTQSVGDIADADAGIIKDTILQQSDIRVLLDQTKGANDFSKTERLLGLTPKDRNLVLSLNRMKNRFNPHVREAFISIGGKYSGVYPVEVSPEEAIAYESEHERKKPFLEAARMNKSYIQAIKDLVSRN